MCAFFPEPYFIVYNVTEKRIKLRKRETGIINNYIIPLSVTIIQIILKLFFFAQFFNL